jgi:hypothetical protein
VSKRQQGSPNERRGRSGMRRGKQHDKEDSAARDENRPEWRKHSSEQRDSSALKRLLDSERAGVLPRRRLVEAPVDAQRRAGVIRLRVWASAQR